jgi:DNA adenine methylase
MPTILNRLGKKTKTAPLIIPHFPPHNTYIELFFGAGGLFFEKPISAHNYLNDLDKDVFNFWTVIVRHQAKFLEMVATMPIDDTLFQYWKTHTESEPLMQALRFMMLSNFGYLGKGNTLLLSNGNPKKQILKNSVDCLKYFGGNVKMMCSDFREVLKKISFRDETTKENCFIYADPPYLNTANNYQSGFTEKDTIDLFQMLVDSGYKFAISEFKNPIILDLAKSHNLNVIEICERVTLKNRNTEILITNYVTLNPSRINICNKYLQSLI